MAQERERLDGAHRSERQRVEDMYGMQVLHPKPYTLHLTPFTLHPAPCMLHPTPHTLHPTQGEEGIPEKILGIVALQLRPESGFERPKSGFERPESGLDRLESGLEQPKSGPESGLDCLVCAKFPRQRTGRGWTGCTAASSSAFFSQNLFVNWSYKVNVSTKPLTSCLLLLIEMLN